MMGAIVWVEAGAVEVEGEGVSAARVLYEHLTYSIESSLKAIRVRRREPNELSRISFWS